MICGKAGEGRQKQEPGKRGLPYSGGWQGGRKGVDQDWLREISQRKPNCQHQRLNSLAGHGILLSPPISAGASSSPSRELLGRIQSLPYHPVSTLDELMGLLKSSILPTLGQILKEAQRSCVISPDPQMQTFYKKIPKCALIIIPRNLIVPTVL